MQRIHQCRRRGVHDRYRRTDAFAVIIIITVVVVVVVSTTITTLALAALFDDLLPDVLRCHVLADIATDHLQHIPIDVIIEYVALTRCQLAVDASTAIDHQLPPLVMVVLGGEGRSGGATTDDANGANVVATTNRQ